MGVAVLCAYVALIPVLFDYGADAPFPVVKALLGHGLAFILSGVLAALAVRDIRGVDVRSWLHAPVFVFLGASVIATIFAADVYTALYGTHRRMLGLGTTAGFIVVYFAVALLIRSRRDVTAVIACALGSALIVLGYEAVQVAGKDPFQWNMDTSLRPFSTLGQPTTLAEYLSVLLVGCIAVAMLEHRINWRARAALVVMSCALLAGMLATQTRSALVGLVAGVAVLIVLTWIKHPSRRARSISLAGAAAATALAALVLALTPLGTRVLGTIELPRTDASGDETGPRLEESVEVRVAIYRIALDMTRDRPLFGYGPDNFAVAMPRYRSDAEPYEVQQSLVTSAHGWAAQAVATTGLVGLASMIAIAVIATALVLRRSFDPLPWAALAMLIAFLGAGLTTVSDVAVDWLFWATAGGIAALTAQPSPSVAASRAPRARHRSHPSAGKPTRSTLVAVPIVVGVALAIAGANAFAASRSARVSQLERLGGHAQASVEAARNATSLDERRPEYWDTLGLAYVRADRLGDAIRAFERATSLAPYNSAFLGDLTSANLLLLQAGDAPAGARARDAANRAVLADPNSPQANLSRAIAMRATGDLSEALRSVERALRLDPSSSKLPLYLAATQIYRANGRTQDAIVTARRGISSLSPRETIPVRVELARALLEAGQTDQAVMELDAALAISPNDQTAQQLRAQIRTSAPSQ